MTNQSPHPQYRTYKRSAIAEMADWHEGFDMTGVSVSDVDRANGSPRAGDKIARNPKNHDDRWLVAAAYFAENFEPTTTATVAYGGEHPNPYTWTVLGRTYQRCDLHPNGCDGRRFA